MRIDLDGRIALVLGDGWAADALRAAVTANGGVAAAADGDAAGWPAAFDLFIDVRGLAGGDAPGDADLGAAAEHLAGGRDPKMLIVLSVLGLVPARMRPGYSAAQAALVARVRTAAMAFGERGIQVNGLALGDEGLVSHVPLGRTARPEEVTAAALFLLDPKNSYTTGHVLAVDGGWQAGYARDF